MQRRVRVPLQAMGRRADRGGRRTPVALAVGECMLELRHRSDRVLELGFAGDTYNTAVYLRRMAQDLGEAVQVGYLTGLGADAYSEKMRAAWAHEGIEDRSVTVPGRQPGVYAVATDGAGERTFSYWRSASAASALFAGTEWVEQLSGDLVHFSGISLQLMSSAAREAFLARLAALRRAGTWVSFDTNFRPAGWPDPGVAREVFAAAAAHADIVLATFDDELLLAADGDPVRTVERYRSHGAREVVVKLGADGALAADATGCRHVSAVPVASVADTTAAGDSFGGAYLAGRLAGLAQADAAELGAELAAEVVQSPGAILPLAASGRAPRRGTASSGHTDSAAVT